MQLLRLVETSRRLAETSRRLEKIGQLAALLNSLSPEEIEIAVAFLSGSYRQQKLNIGYAGLQAASQGSSAELPTLELKEVDATFERIAAVSSGKGSTAELVWVSATPRCVNVELDVARATPIVHGLPGWELAGSELE